MTNIVEFTKKNNTQFEQYIKKGIETYAFHPPENKYQQGFLDAFLIIWEECLGKKHDEHATVKRFDDER